MTAKRMYRYATCGLDDVWLRNGFIVRRRDGERRVAIRDADRLHEAIAAAIVTRPARLRGQEVRFLRARLRLSQANLGQCLGINRVTVARWEGARDAPITEQADHALRMLTALHLKRDEVIERLLTRLHAADEAAGKPERRTFEATHRGWALAA